MCGKLEYIWIVGISLISISICGGTLPTHKRAGRLQDYGRCTDGLWMCMKRDDWDSRVIKNQDTVLTVCEQQMGEHKEQDCRLRGGTKKDHSSHKKKHKSLSLATQESKETITYPQTNDPTGPVPYSYYIVTKRFHIHPIPSSCPHLQSPSQFPLTVTTLSNAFAIGNPKCSRGPNGSLTRGIFKRFIPSQA